MISYKAKAASLELQRALGGTDGLAINNAILDLCEELGGSKKIAQQLVTPMQQIVYMFTLMVQHMPTLTLASDLPASTAEIRQALTPVGRAPGEQPYRVGGEHDDGGDQPG